MAVFDFDQVDEFVPSNNSGTQINFLKLQDNGWYAKVRFMYNTSKDFKVYSVHDIKSYIGKSLPKYVPCLRQAVGEPLENCPLCAAGNKAVAQFYIPLYVISIVSNLRGAQQEQPVNQVMLFQKGVSIRSMLDALKRQCPEGTPIVSSVFRLVRNGKPKDTGTTYTVEYIGTDNVTMEQLPPAPVVEGSYILPNETAEQMREKYLNKQSAAQSPAQQVVNTEVTPRTINANMFGNNTVVGGQPAFAQPAQQFQQVPPQAPQIGQQYKPSGNVPF